MEFRHDVNTLRTGDADLRFEHALVFPAQYT